MSRIERKISRLLASKVTGWWRLAAVLVLEQAAEIANTRNDRDLWMLIDRAYAHGEPWQWPDDEKDDDDRSPEDSAEDPRRARQAPRGAT